VMRAVSVGSSVLPVPPARVTSSMCFRSALERNQVPQRSAARIPASCLPAPGARLLDSAAARSSSATVRSSNATICSRGFRRVYELMVTIISSQISAGAIAAHELQAQDPGGVSAPRSSTSAVPSRM